MGCRGLHVVRYRGRYYVYYNQWDSHPQGWPKDLVREIPRTRKAYKVWLRGQRSTYKAYHDALEEYLSVRHLEHQPEPVSPEASVSQLPCRSIQPVTRSSAWMNCPQTYVLPQYTTQYNDIFIEGVYIIDLDHEVFTVSNRVHFKLSQVSRINWIACLSKNHDRKSVLDLERVPQSAIGMIARPLTLPKYELKDAYTRLNLKNVRAKGLRGSTLSQRHGPLLCAGLFRRFRKSINKDLQHLLGSWKNEYFAFRELAHLILCFASLSSNIAIENGTSLLARFCDGCVDLSSSSGNDGQPELLTLPLTGTHLAGQTAGAWPDQSTYWFEGALIRLVAELEDRDGTFEEQIALLQCHCVTTYPKKYINAMLLSVASVVLITIDAEGAVTHTDNLPLFKLSKDYTVNEGANRAGYAGEKKSLGQSSQVDPTTLEPKDRPSKARGKKNQMMELSMKTMHGVETDEKIAAGCKELHAESRGLEKKGEAVVIGRSQTPGTALAGELSNIETEAEQEGEETREPNTEGDPELPQNGDNAEKTETQNEAPDNVAQGIAEADDFTVAAEDMSEDDILSVASTSTTSSMIPTDNGFIKTRHNADGTQSMGIYRKTIHGGARVTERIAVDPSEDPTAIEDATFYALARFLDVSTRRTIPIEAPDWHPKLPTEVLRVIINAISDVPTYRACLQVSQPFRNICLENFRLDKDAIFTANEITKGDCEEAMDLARSDRLDTNCVNSGSEVVERVKTRNSIHSTFLGNLKSQYTWFAVAGSVRDKRILVQGTGTVFC